METRANHVLIGAFTLLGLGLVLVFGLWTARFQADSAWQDYEIRFEQAVSGLSVGSAVQFNGINMGNVRELYLDPDDPRQVVAVVRLKGDAPVRADTVARLSISGLTGVAFIQLRGGSPEQPRLESGPDGQLPVIVAEESPLQRLIDASEDIASTASEVLLRVLDFLSEENAERVSQTLDNIDAFTVALSSEKDLISDILRNAHRGSEQLVEVLGGASQTIEEVSQALAGIEEHLIDILPELSEDLSDTLGAFASLSRRLDNVIADNEQALSEFGVESLAQFGPALEEFRHLIRELSRLSNRFERHPTRFLLGGDQPEEYQPQ
jgi:phospholipid/cholesterol/gamma-HCH transport system substrate-binding protein